MPKTARGPKRVATMQDLACYGRCSLSIALPVLSAAGVEACPLPTALYSTHTGGFGAPEKLDLTAQIDKIAAHWSSIGLFFDGIYTGYLGNAEQICTATRFIDRFRTSETLVVVDPAMADNGKFYSGFDADFAAQMASLCVRANVILPNLTEASMLLAQPYDARTDADYAAGLARALAEKFSVRAVVLTGVTAEDGAKIGAGVLDGGAFSLALADRVPTAFHGTGDLFASVFTAGAVRGQSYAEAAQRAADFTAHCIAATVADPHYDERDGVRFEQCLGELTDWTKETEK